MIKIDIVSDVSCPWCIIGYCSLNTALEQMGLQDSVAISWKPFELNPQMPAGGQDVSEHLQMKYGITEQQSRANRDHIRQRGEQVGYRFNFDGSRRIYNTFKAHQLIHWAGEFDRQTELKLALFDLYFQDQGNPDDEESLIASAVKVGLDEEDAREVLNSARYADRIRAEIEQAYQLGISAVPAFIFNDSLLVSGGQARRSICAGVD